MFSLAAFATLFSRHFSAYALVSCRLLSTPFFPGLPPSFSFLSPFFSSSSPPSFPLLLSLLLSSSLLSIVFISISFLHSFFSPSLSLPPSACHLPSSPLLTHPPPLLPCSLSSGLCALRIVANIEPLKRPGQNMIEHHANAASYGPEVSWLPDTLLVDYPTLAAVTEFIASQRAPQAQVLITKGYL